MNKEFTINGVAYTNFGANNYSYGMDPVIFDPKDITPKEVRDLDGFFLNPFQEPNSLEIFALKGTEDQYSEFLSNGTKVYATKGAVRVYGLEFDDEEVNQKRNELIDKIASEFVPWFVKEL